MMKTLRATAPVVILAAAVLGMADASGQDNSMVPPAHAFRDGKPVQFMKSLNEIEPRKKISSLPADIFQAGSYYVTGNLTGEMGRVGITIRSPDVNLDLSGFSLVGSSDTASAIVVEPHCVNVRIRDGLVRGWGGFGVDAGGASDVELTNVRAFTNHVGGLCVGSDSMVVDCGAYRNVGEGIRVGGGSTVRDCKARGNTINGIYAAGASFVSGCISTFNKDNGFFLESYCTIRDCTAAWNAGNGIVTRTGCRVESNNCGGNGMGRGDGAGILVNGSANRIEGNMLTSNRLGIAASNAAGNGSGQGNLIIRNSSRDSELVEYDIDPLNAFGEILDDTGSGGRGITNRNPWVNFVLPK